LKPQTFDFALCELEPEVRGKSIIVATDGEMAMEAARNDLPEMAVLDLNLPRRDGAEVLEFLRSLTEDLPILILTARQEPETRLRCLEMGADDYLPKPFELAILIARLESLLRRSVWMKHADRADPVASNNDDKAQQASTSEESGDSFSFGGKSIDFAELELRTLGNTIHLTVMEAEFLRYLVRSEGRVVSRKAILEEVWGLHEDTDTRAIDNFVVRLRRYIEEDPSQPKHLQTVRGVGYRFVAEPA